MKARIINSKEFGGIHSLTWLNNNQNLSIGGQLVSEWTLSDILPNQTFKQPEWNGSEWFDAYIEIINIEEKEQEIIKRYNYLKMRALSSSMEKYGSYEYLINQKQEYDEKYLVAKGLKISVPLSSSLQKKIIESWEYLLKAEVVVNCVDNLRLPKGPFKLPKKVHDPKALEVLAKTHGLDSSVKRLLSALEL